MEEKEDYTRLLPLHYRIVLFICNHLVLYTASIILIAAYGGYQYHIYEQMGSQNQDADIYKKSK